MRFLLIRPLEMNPNRRIHTPSYAPSLYPPLGLEYIAASLEAAGHSVEIIDCGLEPLSQDRLRRSLTIADAVGMSVYTNSYHNAKKVSELIREIDTQIPLIIGGPHCIFLQQNALHDIPAADIAVAGEGEQAIVDIADYLKGKKSLAQTHGIHYRKKK